VVEGRAPVWGERRSVSRAGLERSREIEKVKRWSGSLGCVTGSGIEEVAGQVVRRGDWVDMRPAGAVAGFV
jgi:hypothetical protein